MNSHTGHLTAALRVLTICSILCLPAIARAALPAGCIAGVLTDSETGEPVDWAAVSIVELHRLEPAHEGGRFTFCSVPAGSYTLEVRLIGYRTAQYEVLVRDRDTTFLNIGLQPSILQTEEVVVTARRGGSDWLGNGATQTLSGASLQQSLGRTLAETIEGEPGVSQQSMGPATARPVVRGLGGNRLVILEDGASTGDASSISSDHAVTADPLAAERIEILRGPASFVYSSNALGGILNMEREKTITNRPDRVHGTGSIQGETVNTGIAVGASLGIPAGPLGVQVHGSYRSAGDINTPDGTIANSDLETFDGSVAAAWLFPSGSVRGSGGHYRSSYGIPGVPGGHEEGVRIDMDRTQYAANLDYHIDSSFLKRIRTDLGFTRYYHREVEPEGSIGTEFGILTSAAAVRFHHDSVGRITDAGILSLQGEHVNLAANGLNIPETNEQSIAASLFEQKQFGRVTLSGAVRFDLKTVRPMETDSSEVGRIRARTFSGLSGGVAASVRIVDHLYVEGSAARAFRAPSVEELFSEGPHLASYSYEIGNADLHAETGLSIEGSLRYTTSNGHARLTVFRNAIDDFVFPSATGDTNFRTLLPIYQHRGENALFNGVETEVEHELPGGLILAGALGYVSGTRSGGSAPLPFIPPLNGSVALRWSTGFLFTGASARFAAAQRRVGEFEEPTEGYGVLDAFVQYRIASEQWMHVIVVKADNVFDTAYRNHLSRLKSVLPEPGRNLRLLYRLYF